MKLETYLDAYAKAYYEFEDGELDSYRHMRQRNKFRQRIIDHAIWPMYEGVFESVEREDNVPSSE